MDAGFNEQIARYVRESLLSWLASDGTTSEYTFRIGMVLTPEAKANREEFMREYDGGNCSCHLSPPCFSCTHPGNPRNQEEDDDCWMPVLKGGA